MNIEELKRYISQLISKNPEYYPVIIELATFSFQEYKKGVDKKEANLLLLCGLIDKKNRKYILSRINHEMFDHHIIDQLKGKYDPKV